MQGPREGGRSVFAPAGAVAATAVTGDRRRGRAMLEFVVMGRRRLAASSLLGARSQATAR